VLLHLLVEPDEALADRVVIADGPRLLERVAVPRSPASPLGHANGCSRRMLRTSRTRAWPRRARGASSRLLALLAEDHGRLLYLQDGEEGSCGISTLPTCFMRFLPSFCLSSSLRLREMSPP